MIKVDEYLNELYIQEDINKFIKELPPVNKNMVAKLKGSVNDKDPLGSMKKISKISPPGFSKNGFKIMAKIDGFMNNKFDDFGQMRNTATKVVKNSIPNISPKMAAVSGSFLAFHSMFTKKSQQNMASNQILKMNIKDFISRARKFGEDFEDEDEEKKSKMRPSDMADLIAAWTMITMITALAVGLGSGVYITAKFISAAIAIVLPGILTTTMWVILGVIIAFAVTAIGLAIAGGVMGSA